MVKIVNLSCLQLCCDYNEIGSVVSKCTFQKVKFLIHKPAESYKFIYHLKFETHFPTKAIVQTLARFLHQSISFSLFNPMNLSLGAGTIVLFLTPCNYYPKISSVVKCSEFQCLTHILVLLCAVLKPYFPVPQRVTMPSLVFTQIIDPGASFQQQRY